jgi:hypothetical protein
MTQPFEPEETPLWKRIEGMRDRLMTATEELPVATEIEGTLRDMWHLGQMVELEPQQWRLPTVEELQHVQDLAAWWYEQMGALIERQKRDR